MKNLRLIMSIIATVIVVAISLYFIFGYQPGDLFNRQVNDDGTSSAVQHNQNAQNLYSEGKYDEAIAECAKAVELDSKYAEAYNTRGRCYFHKEQCDLAITDFDKAINLDPKDSSFYNNKGVALSWLDRYEEAISCYEMALDIDPQDYIVWGNKGVSLENLGRYEEAMTSYNNVLQLNPSDEDAQNNKDRLLERGVPDKGPNIRISGHTYTLDVTGPIMVLHVTEGEAFDATISVSHGLPPYYWHLISPGVSAQNVLLNPTDEGGETVEVSGVGAFVSGGGTTHRLGWVVYEVEDSSEPAKWGRGSFVVDVYPLDEGKIAEQVARDWAQSQYENLQAFLQGAVPYGVYGNVNVSYSKPAHLGNNSYSVVVTSTMAFTASSEGVVVRVNVSVDDILTIDTKEKVVVNVQQGEPRVSYSY